ncbi:MAG: PAS domain-containing protein [Gammaproteobacteria bacterium]
MLFQQLPSALFAHAVNVGIMGYLLSDAVDPGILVTWLILMGLMVSGRLVQCYIYSHSDPPVSAAPRWGRYFLSGLLVAAFGWGLLGGWLFPQDSYPHQVLIGFVLAGMAAAGTTTLSSVRGAAMLFIIPALMPYAANLLLRWDEIHLGMAAMTCLFIGMLHQISNRLYRSVEESLRLRFENVDLLGELIDARDHQEIVNRELKAEIGERRRTELTLQEREALVRAVINSLSAGIAVLDRQGIIVSSNDAWGISERNGMDVSLRGATVGSSYLDLCRHAGANNCTPGLVRDIEAVLQGTLAETTSEYVASAVGEKRWYLLSITALKGPHGGAVVSHIDITEQKRAEERMLLAAVFDNTNEGIFILDTRMRVVAVNRAFTEITGFVADEVLNHRTNSFYSFRKFVEAYRQMARALRASGRWQGEIDSERKSGEAYPAWISISSVRVAALLSEYRRRPDRRNLEVRGVVAMVAS